MFLRGETSWDATTCALTCRKHLRNGTGSATHVALDYGVASSAYSMGLSMVSVSGNPAPAARGMHSVIKLAFCSRICPSCGGRTVPNFKGMPCPDLCSQLQTDIAENEVS
jgi:hypothetical protein